MTDQVFEHEIFADFVWFEPYFVCTCHTAVFTGGKFFAIEPAGTINAGESSFSWCSKHLEYEHFSINSNSELCAWSRSLSLQLMWRLICVCIAWCFHACLTSVACAAPARAAGDDWTAAMGGIPNRLKHQRSSQDVSLRQVHSGLFVCLFVW